MNKKAKELLQQPDAAKHVSSTAGTNTNYTGLVTNPMEEGRFEYKNSNIFAFIVGLKEISGKLIELAKVPESTWNPQAQGYTDSMVKIPAVLAGGADQTLEEFTDGLQFVDLALDIAAEPAKAKQIWDGIRQIRPETVKNIIREHVATYTAGGPKAFYQGGRDGITIAFMWKGLAGAATKLAGYASQLSSVADQVQQAGATMIGLVTGTSKVADEVLELLKKLQRKFSNEQNFLAFLQEYGRDDALTTLSQFDTGFLDIKAWEILRTLPSGKMWVRSNKALLNRMVGRTDTFKENIRLYYESFQLPSNRTGDPPIIYNNVSYDAFGHPNFVPFVPQLADGRKIKYVPATDSPTRVNLTGDGADISAANNWGVTTFGDNFRKKLNGRCEIRNQNGEWVECVWHHHEDGRTMMPVPTEIHNRSYASAGTGAPHTGGAAVIKYGIQDFFTSPNY